MMPDETKLDGVAAVDDTTAVTTALRAAIDRGDLPVMHALASLTLSRLRLDNVAGYTFQGKRNLYEALGYSRVLRLEDYRSRFERNGIAARVVEVKPQATWRGIGELVEDDDPSTFTVFEKTWAALESRLHMWNIFERADVMAGLGRYAVILLGAPGEFETPITKLDLNELYYVSVFGEEDAPIAKFVTDQYHPRFGQPEFYSFKRLTSRTPITPAPDVPYTSPSGVAGDVGRRVHWTRCLHVADGLLDDLVYGVPRLQRIWNLLDDLDKVTGGGSEAYWKRADQGTQFDLDKELELNPEELKKLKDSVEEYTHRLKRVLTTRGVKVNSLGSDVASFATEAAAIINQIAAAVGIPQRILLGSEAGHLASTQDTENWSQRIRDRRYSYAEPIVVRPFVDRLIGWGTLPKPVKYEVRWDEVQGLSDDARAGLATKLANVNKIMGEEVVSGDEIRDRVLGWPTKKGVAKTDVPQHIQRVK